MIHYADSGGQCIYTCMRYKELQDIIAISCLMNFLKDDRSTVEPGPQGSEIISLSFFVAEIFHGVCPANT